MGTDEHNIAELVDNVVDEAVSVCTKRHASLSAGVFAFGERVAEQLAARIRARHHGHTTKPGRRGEPPAEGAPPPSPAPPPPGGGGRGGTDSGR